MTIMNGVLDMIIETLKHALMITSFVFVMMLVIEYLNVQTRGNWQELLRGSKWLQYALSAFLGVTPGCLGAFTVVALYTHNIVSLGALVAAMVATCGDEAYVMFSMFPSKALILTLVLFGLGVVSGFMTDIIFKPDFKIMKRISELEFHEEYECRVFSREDIVNQFKNLTLQRGLLMVILVFFLAGLIFNQIGPSKWNWIKITFLLGALFALFIVSTVPEHFLEEHLWEHIGKAHVPRIFLWTFGALLLLHIIVEYMDLGEWISANHLTIMVIACLIGLIPESGPHMIFVTLFAEGTIPFSILLASSVVQDGHGMLPLLAESKRGFVFIKIINFVVGLFVGIFGYILGF